MTISDRYVSGEYFAKNPTFHVEDAAWKAGQIRKMLDAQGAAPMRLAEIGCGAGEILVQLAQSYEACQLSGFELSPQGYALCKARESARIRFHNSDFRDVPAKSFDVVLCIDVFEHIEDPLAFLRDIRRAGEAFIFHIPLDMNVQMVLRSEPILRVRAQVGHLHYFSKDTALATLADGGYDVRAWFYTPSGADRPKTLKARALQLPRKLLSKVNQELTARVLGGFSLMVYALPKR